MERRLQCGAHGMLRAVWFAMCLSSLCAVPDSVREEDVLHRIAFGSCSKPFYPQPLWDAVLDYNPQLWLWTGDAVYLGRGQPSDLGEALRAQTKQAGYKKLLDSKVVVEGVYDDHDYGRNDAGKYFPTREKSQQEFLNFLGVSENSARRERKGVYSSHLFGPAAQRVKLIQLDTRYHRDSHLLPSIGGSRIPFGALVAAALRALCVAVGVGSMYDGDMLGDKQWAWLEEELAVPAQVTVLVSSVQVLTSNSLVESWLHFPLSLLRLLSLLRRFPQKNLLIVSGDVHYAELLGLGGLEMTSSGMTHTCATAWWGGACAPILRSFPAHRHEDDAGFYTGYNFGTIDLTWAASGPQVTAAIRDVNGSKVLKVAVQEDATAALQEAMAQVKRRQQTGVKWRAVAVVVAVGAVGVGALLGALTAVCRSLSRKLAVFGVGCAGGAASKRE